MADTFVKIASVTVGSGGASSIDFTSIPNTYTDLNLLLSLRSNDTGGVYEYLKISLNGSTSSFTGKYLMGSGSSVSTGSTTDLIGIQNGDLATTSTFGSGSIYITNYATTNYKSISAENIGETNATTIYMMMNAQLWSNSAAINAISIKPNSTLLWKQFSTATLYGISKS